MLKKIISYVLIVFGLGVLCASTSRTAMQYISDKRDHDKWWGSYQGLHGDLVSMSYLDFVQQFNPAPTPRIIKHPAYSAPNNTVLYLHGDSYSRHLSDTAFAGVSKLYLIDRNHGLNYHLDSTKRNILLIEVSERYLREYFGSLRMLDEVCDSVIKKKNIALLNESIALPHTQYASMLGDFNLDDLFNRNINQNLQGNLFNYNFIMPMFEYKAALNYYIFNRASGDVVISKDRKFLFYKETVSYTDMGSSYVPVSAEDITNVINNLNTIYDYYKANGFKEVYLSVIPNTATIMQPEGYNNLIPRVQNDARLKIKLIDAYTAFKNSSQPLFLTGDTHWNNAGRQLWLDMVNEHLINDKQ